MSTTQEAKNGGKRSTAPVQDTSPSGDDDGDFVDVGLDRFMWNPNKGCDQPVYGYLIGLEHMQPIKDRDWDCLVIRLTRPTKALNRDKQPVTVEAGRDILVPATYQLAQTFTKAALNPTHCFEVKIKPAEKVDVGGGQKMWTYTNGVNPKNPKPRSAFGIAALLGPSAPIRALPQNTEEIPF